MMTILERNWWAVALRGAAGIVFGVLTLIWPAITLEVLVLFFGAYALVDGLFAIVSGVAAARHHGRWGVLLIEGVLGILAAFVAFVWPGLTVVMLGILIGAWALVTGGVEIAAAVRLRRALQGEWLLGLAGAMSIVFGIVMVLFPLSGAVALVWLLGAYGLVFGVLLLGLGLRLRASARRRIHIPVHADPGDRRGGDAGGPVLTSPGPA